MYQNHGEIAEILMDLGLTFLQAKTYIMLCKLQNADVKTIAECSKIARQDIYRIIPDLEKSGLVEKIVGPKKLFRATPLKEGLSILLEKKTSNYNDIQRRIKLLSEKVETTDNIHLHSNTFKQFVITFEKTLFLRKMKAALIETNINKKGIFTSNELKFMLFYNYQETQDALDRGVHIRIITEKPEKTTELEVLMRKPNFELRYISDHIPVTLVLFDDKDVNIRLSEENKPVSSLWTDNPYVVKLSEIYFEYMWNKVNVFKYTNKPEG